MGEGSAVLILEEWSRAEARGANIIGEILGSASNADAHHITAPSPGGVGAISCMRLALAEAGIEASDVKQVNAHGTSTPLNDEAEAAAVTEVFGARNVPVVSIKGVTGHALGAAGALEAAAALLSIEKRLIPPTANTKVLGDEMTIDVVMGEARPWEPGPVISNNFGFGGHNGSVVIAPADLTRPDPDLPETGSKSVVRRRNPAQFREGAGSGVDDDEEQLAFAGDVAVDECTA